MRKCDEERAMSALEAFIEQCQDDLKFMAGDGDQIDELVPGWDLCFSGRAFAAFAEELQRPDPAAVA